MSDDLFEDSVDVGGKSRSNAPQSRSGLDHGPGAPQPAADRSRAQKKALQIDYSVETPTSSRPTEARAGRWSGEEKPTNRSRQRNETRKKYSAASFAAQESPMEDPESLQWNTSEMEQEYLASQDGEPRRRLSDESVERNQTETTSEETTYPGAERVSGWGRTPSDGAGSVVSQHNPTQDGLLSQQAQVVAQAELVNEPVEAETVDVDALFNERYEGLQQQTVTRRRRKRRRASIFLLIVTLLLAVIVAVVLVVGRNRGKINQTNTPTTMPTTTSTPTTFNPTPFPSPPTTEVDTIALILFSSPSTSFEDPSSPQRLALDWLLFDNFTQQMLGSNGDRVLQRFALAVLWYATGGNTTWDPSPGWLNATSECEWESVGCSPQSNLVETMDFRAPDYLSGRLPIEIGLLTALTFLRVDYCDLRRSSIPTELGKLTSLRSLTLHRSKLTGTIPTELLLLTALTELTLSRNSISGSIPEDLSPLVRLEDLYLHENELSGSVSPFLCSTLKRARVDCDRVDCSCCQDGRNSSVSCSADPTELELTWVGLIQSRSPAISFEESSSPQRLALNWLLSDNFTKTVVEDNDDRVLQRFALATLWFATGRPGPGWLRSNSECDWQYESASLEISCDAENSIEELSIQNLDSQSGSLPKEVGLLTSLTRMFVSSPNMLGSIPTEIGAWTDLNYLFLVLKSESDALLGGTIPSEVGWLTALTFLSLVSNKLSGKVPMELGNLTNLQILYLASNQLTGSIPSNLCTSLTKCQIDCGEIECECCQSGAGQHDQCR